MEIYQKAFTGVDIKSESEGRISCVFRQHNIPDMDNETTTPASFTDGQEVVISPWGHSVWDSELPVGKGIIRMTPTEGIFEGAYFLHIPKAREQFETIRAMGRSEWSFGFTATRDKDDNSGVTTLRDVHMFEVSPVLRGAMGPGRTRLVDARSAPTRERPMTRLDEINLRIARVLMEQHAAEREVARQELLVMRDTLRRNGDI